MEKPFPRIRPVEDGDLCALLASVDANRKDSVYSNPKAWLAADSSSNKILSSVLEWCLRPFQFHSPVPSQDSSPPTHVPSFLPSLLVSTFPIAVTTGRQVRRPLCSSFGDLYLPDLAGTVSIASSNARFLSLGWVLCYFRAMLGCATTEKGSSEGRDSRSIHLWSWEEEEVVVRCIIWGCFSEEQRWFTWQ